jgi:hypothetical protein
MQNDAKHLTGIAARHCEARLRRSNPDHFRGKIPELLRGACHRAARCADPLARNDAQFDGIYQF